MTRGHFACESERGRWRKQISPAVENLDERNSGKKERKEEEKEEKEEAVAATAAASTRRGKTLSISRTITYLNAVPVISCCPLFDNDLRGRRLPRDIHFALLRSKTKQNENSKRTLSHARAAQR